MITIVDLKSRKMYRNDTKNKAKEESEFRMINSQDFRTRTKTTIDLPSKRVTCGVRERIMRVIKVIRIIKVMRVEKALQRDKER